MSSLMRWDPFRDMVTLREAMDRLFEESFVRPRGERLAPLGAEALAVDIYETDNDIVVKASLPGVKPEEIDVSVTGNTLSIKGETKAEEEVKTENYIRRERRCGAFSRSLTLPTDVTVDKATAEFEHGVLTLTLPKVEEVKPRSIKIKAKGN